MVMTTGFIRRGITAEKKVFVDSLFDWRLIATILCETEKVWRNAMAQNEATERMSIILATRQRCGKFLSKTL